MLPEEESCASPLRPRVRRDRRALRHEMGHREDDDGLPYCATMGYGIGAQAGAHRGVAGAPMPSLAGSPTPTTVADMGSIDDVAALLPRLDQEFSDNGVALYARPILAMREIGTRLHLSFLMTDTGGVASFINGWFKKRYGDALNMDRRVGRTVVELAGTLWRMRIPLGFGEVSFVADPRAGFRGNIVDYCESDVVTSLPQGLRESLTQADLRRLMECFQRAYGAIYALVSEHKLVLSAKADLATAVERLT